MHTDMIEIVSKWGANYLVTDEGLHVRPGPIHCRSGLTIRTGDRITRLGVKRRNCFEMQDGLYMVYEGLYEHEGIVYAIFSVPFWDAPELEPIRMVEFFTSRKSPVYYYAFAVVAIGGKVNCFLQFNKKGNGSRDISLEYIDFYDKK